MNRAEAAGALLAERHQDLAEPDASHSLTNYAEAPRRDDWTLRSALVRFAQPEPTRAGAVLELVRRCDAALHPLGRALEQHTVDCDRSLSFASVRSKGDGWELDAPAHPYPDARVADLARMIEDEPSDGPALLDAYRRTSELTPEEEAALPILRVVLELDALADALVEWTASAPANPPVGLVDRSCRAVHARLEELGVPTETRPEGPGRGGGRQRRS